MLVIAGPDAHDEGAELASGAQLEREQKRAQQRTKPVDCEARGEGIPHTCSAVRPEDESIVRVVWFVDGARAAWVSIDAAHSQDRFYFLGVARAAQRRTQHAAHADPQVIGIVQNHSLGVSKGIEPIFTYAQARSAPAPLPLRSRSAPAPLAHAPPQRTGARSQRGGGLGLPTGVLGDLRPVIPPYGAELPFDRAPSAIRST